MKIIAYIGAAIFIFFGVLFIWAASSPTEAGAWGRDVVIGIISILVGFGLIWLASRQKAAAAGDQKVTLNVDLPGNVNLDQMTCKNCGGRLSSENVKMVAGAPVVTCPYCGTTYQLTEEPKW